MHTVQTALKTVVCLFPMLYIKIGSKGENSAKEGNTGKSGT